MSILDRARLFADSCNRHGVLDEDGEPMSTEEAERAITSVLDRLADEGQRPNLDTDYGWWQVEALVLDRFGADPDALEG